MRTATKLALVSNKSVTRRPTLKLTEMDKLALAAELMLEKEYPAELVDQIDAYATKLKSSPVMRRWMHRHIKNIQVDSNLEPYRKLASGEIYLAHCIALLHFAESFTLTC